MPSCCVVELEVLESSPASLTLSEPQLVEWRTGEYVPYRPQVDEYDGPYSLVPGDVAQTLGTAGLLMVENVTVGAIPSNYGKISWDGAALTVS